MTIYTVRNNGLVAFGGDRQVSLGDTIIEADATKNTRLPMNAPAPALATGNSR